MRVPVLVALTLAALPVVLISVSAEPEFFVVTERGNIFPIEVTSGDGKDKQGGDDSGDDSGDAGGDGDDRGDAAAEQLQASIASDSQIAYSDVHGDLITRTSGHPYERSLTPYMDLEQGTDFFMAVVDPPIVLDIPAFYHEYKYNKNLDSISLKKVLYHELSHDSLRSVSGNVVVTESARDNLEFSGNGRTILKYADPPAIELIITSNITEGSSVRIIESSSDLTTIPTRDLNSLMRDLQRGANQDDIKELHSFTLTDHGAFSIPEGTIYLLIDSNGGSSDIRIFELKASVNLNKGQILREVCRPIINNPGFDRDQCAEDFIQHAYRNSPEKDYFKITGLHRDIGYHLQHGETSSVGHVTSGTIKLHTAKMDIFPQQNGVLEIFRDPLMFSGDADGKNFILDHKNSQILALPSTGSSLYNVQAYVKIPVPSDVTISNVTLANTEDGVSLPYLGGDYVGGDSLFIPIIPQYKILHLGINDIDATFRIGDIVRHESRIADPSVSGRSLADSDFIDSVSATTGTTTYFIAKEDGNMKAIISARVSGEATITNTITYVIIPPPPPPDPPRARDPLTTWVQVHVNGELRAVNGEDATQIHFDDSPQTVEQATRTRTASSVTLAYTYDPITIDHFLSVPVQSGDFVEVYFYNQVEGFGDNPTLPRNAVERTRSGVAEATAVLEFAEIRFSQ